MFKIILKSANNLSEISIKPVKIDIIRKPKIEKCKHPNNKIKNYVYTHYPNTHKFELGSDYLAIHNLNHGDSNIIIINLDEIING